MEEKITLQTDTGESVDFYVLEETPGRDKRFLFYCAPKRILKS